MGQVWTGLAGILVTVAIAGCAGGSSSEVEEVRSIDRPDAEVFMTLRATPAQTRAIRRAVRTSRQVKEFAYLTKADAYRLFRKLFADQPDLVDSTVPDQLPTSFPVTLHEDADPKAFAASVQRLPGVDEIKTAPPAAPYCREVLDENLTLRPPGEVEVFMSVAATEEQIAAVRADIAASPVIVWSRFLTQEDAYREFQRIFADKPELIATTSPDQLPTSFKMIIPDAQDRENLELRLLAFAGIDEVKVQRDDPISRALRNVVLSCLARQ